MAVLGVDARVEDLRIKLVKDINEANMPACILHYVLADLLENVVNQEKEEIKRERQEYQDEKVKESLKTEGIEEPITNM